MLIEKMLLQGFADDKFLQPATPPYPVFLNPKSFAHNYANTYSTARAVGQPGQTPRFEGADSDTLAFDLTLDGTRAIEGHLIKVDTEVAAIKNVVFAYHGQDHSPYYVQVTWGSFQFNGRLTSFDVDYTLFRPDGVPLRATLALAFIGFTDAELMAQLAGNESADLSHRRVVKGGETLAQLCYEVYGDSKYYLQVARYNSLLNFTRLKPGTVLNFPPLRA